MSKRRFRRGNYTQVSVPAPGALINRAQAPQAMGTKYARDIENMLPSKKGTLAKRFGVTDKEISGITSGEKILAGASYGLSDGTFKLVVYTDGGKIYHSNTALTSYTQIKSGLTTSGVTPRFSYFNSKLIICDGINNNMCYDGTSVDDLQEYVEDALASNLSVTDEDTFTLDTASREDGDYPNGRAIRLDISASDLAVTSITRSGTTATATTTQSHNLADGTVVTIAGANESEYNGTVTITNVTATTFDYTVSGSPSTPATGTITYSFSNVVVDATVLSTSYSSPTLTVNTTASFGPNSASVTLNSVDYLDKPEPFSMIFPAHDRLWALSGGELKAEAYRNSADRMKVFYTDSTNNENAWFNATTQEVPYINLADKHTVNDELIGIGLFYSKLVFFGRRNTQLWTGTDPTASGDLSWNRTINVGALHGNLIQNIENDLVFYTTSGVRNFSVAFQNNDIESQQEIGAEIPPMVKDQVEFLLDSDEAYKKARSFRYPIGGFFGFRMPRETHIRDVEEYMRGWSRFTGIFSRAADFTLAPDGKLYLFWEESTYIYDDANEVFDDDGEDIKTSWATPWLQPKKGHSFAGRYLELVTEPGDEMNVTITRLKDNDVAAKTTTVLVSPLRAAFWDDAFWDVDFWDSGGDTALPVKEDKFIDQFFAYIVQTNNQKGPLEIVALNVYGKPER